MTRNLGLCTEADIQHDSKSSSNRHVTKTDAKPEETFSENDQRLEFLPIESKGKFLTK